MNCGRAALAVAAAAAAKLMILFSSGWEVMRTAGRLGTPTSSSSDATRAEPGPPTARRVLERALRAAAG